jgi:hypothetical protein
MTIRADINIYKAKRKGRNIPHPDICNKINKENPVDSLEILNSTI